MSVNKPYLLKATYYKTRKKMNYCNDGTSKPNQKDT